MQKPFLTANWQYLAMLNFAVDPQLLHSRVPFGTELDFHNGETFLSMVGFLFLDTRVIGLPIPWHRNFEEVNLRFYVRRRSGDVWRRGVSFVRELVPRRAIALVARMFYGEPYLALPMRHDVLHRDGEVAVSYGWRRGKKWESISMRGADKLQAVLTGSHEEFITEHYWGYTARNATKSSEYQVEHPHWQLWPAQTWKLEADVAALYGAEFVETFSARPVSAFIAEGSHVEVRRGSRELS